MRRNIFGAAALSFLVMTGCIAGKTQTEKDANVAAARTSQQNNSEEIKALVGQEFEIKLQGNPSTGYDWQIAKMDERLLKLTGEDFVTNAPGGVVGSSGTAVFKLLPLKTGETELTLNYKRPWASDVLKSTTYKIIIADAVSNDEDPSLLCQLNRTQSIGIYSKEQKVTLNSFPSSKIPLDLINFMTYRCPNCFSFDGKVGNLHVTGSTRSEFRGTAVVTLLSAEIDGKKQPEVVCTVPSAH